MKILHVITRFDFGGAENYVRELSNELANQGHDVYILSKKGRQNNLLNSKVHFLKTTISSNSIIFKAIRLIRIVKKYNIDVIHAHQRLPIVSACIAGIIRQKPVVVTVHGRVKYDLRSKVSRKVPSCFIFVSSKVLTVSKFYKQLVEKSVIIPNGIPKTSINYKHVPYQIGYVSRLDAKHATVIYTLMAILPKLSNEFKGVSLSIIGDGGELENIRKIAKNINASLGYEAIIVHGYIENLSHQEVVPELTLGVGRVAIESAIKGCSVISINSKRMGHILNSENYEFYKENNFVNIKGVPPTEELIYTEISNFFKNRNTHRNESIQLTKAFHNDFDIERIAEKISIIYTKAVNEMTIKKAE